MTVLAHLILLVTSLTGLVTAIVTLRKTQSTHKIVNSQRTAMLAHAAALTAALQAAGVAVPPDASLPPTNSEQR